MMRMFDTHPQPLRSYSRRGLIAAAVLLVASLISVPAQSRPPATDGAAAAASATATAARDSALVRSLPGFRNGYATVNGTRIHYVIGGQGAPLFLLPGWPQTWWEFHKIMPALAARYQVVAVDLRGMGGSAKPDGGYDKKNMAEDIAQLAAQLGFDKINVAGHDIGSGVAFSLAANRPGLVMKLALMDVPHPDEFWTQMLLLPPHGTFGDKIDERHPGYPWWFAFHQVKKLPEKLLAGRMHIYQDWIFDYLSLDSKSIVAKDRAVYKAAYAGQDAIRAGDAWYQTFTQDALDIKTYPKLTMPVLGLGATGYEWLKASLPSKVSNFKLVKVENSGHFMAEEQPAFVAEEMIRFFD